MPKCYAQMLNPNAGVMLKERGIVDEIVNAGTLDRKGQSFKPTGLACWTWRTQSSEDSCTLYIISVLLKYNRAH